MAEQETTAIVRRETVAGNRGLMVQNLSDLWRLAEAAFKSRLAPKSFDCAEAVFVAMQSGMELGLPPMASLRGIAVINGRPSVYGDVQKGLVESSGLCEWCEETHEGEGEAYVSICRVKRVGRPPVGQRFGVSDAKRAGLWGKAGPWQQYPKRMMQMRARSFALRDAFPDVLQGMLSAEEERDIAGPQADEPTAPATGATNPELPQSQANTLNAMLNDQSADSPIGPEEAARIAEREAAEAAAET